MTKKNRDRKRINRRYKKVMELFDANHAYKTLLIDLSNTKKFKQFVKSFYKIPNQQPDQSKILEL